MAKKSSCPRFFYIIALVVFCLFLNVSAFAQVKGKADNSLKGWMEQFKGVANLPCGERTEVFRIAGIIISGFGNDKANDDVIEWVNEQVRIIDKQETICKTEKPENLLGRLVEEFKLAFKQPCGERDEALSLGNVIVQKFGDEDAEVVDWIKNQISCLEIEEKTCKEADSLEVLFDNYKLFRKQPCGEREKVIELGKRILELHRSDPDNQPVILYVEKDVAKMEKDERICRRNNLYNQSYKAKDWKVFMAVSKEIVDEEGDKSPLALDVMLTFVQVGYDLTAYEKNDFYNPDTLQYAKKAIEMIESGVPTQSRWGVFQPFGTKSKALAWLNYIVGYISYFRLKEGKKAIPYFYKATKFNAEFKYDAFVYQAVAIYYFDKEFVSASSLTINDFITKANNAADAVDADVSTEEAAKNREIATLYRQLVNLYNLRYNLATGENATDLTDYILKLINRPLIDSAANSRKTLRQIK